MKSPTTKGIRSGTALLLAVLIVGLGGCSEYGPTELRAMKETVTKLNEEKAMTDRRLVKYDAMDFDAISKQQWETFDDIHAADVVVSWPDGHSTKGIAAHAEEAKALISFAPDAWVEAHPVKFGSGEWTCVTGTVVGTFSRPMLTMKGKVIQPTGKRFSIPMCALARWKDGKIVEKSLYWDNQMLMNQLGMAR